jgi:ABC-type sulfate transport system permease subunit
LIQERWYLKTFAVSPVSAGVVALITAGVGGTVGGAVSQGMRSVYIGEYIPGISLNRTIKTP